MEKRTKKQRTNTYNYETHPPTRKAFALYSLALLAFFIAGVMVWKGNGKSQSDQSDDSASRLRNTGASAGNTGTLGATQAPPAPTPNSESEKNSYPIG
jgi:hypothetical protein